MVITYHTYDVVGSYMPTKEMGGGSGLKYAASTIIYLSKKKDKEGSGIFLLPSSLGYGKSPPSSSTIPPNSVLVFAMDLVDVK